MWFIGRKKRSPLPILELKHPPNHHRIWMLCRLDCETGLKLVRPDQPPHSFAIGPDGLEGRFIAEHDFRPVLIGPMCMLFSKLQPLGLLRFMRRGFLAALLDGILRSSLRRFWINLSVRLPNTVGYSLLIFVAVKVGFLVTIVFRYFKSP
jgi:hypothetical protein